MSAQPDIQISIPDEAALVQWIVRDHPGFAAQLLTVNAAALQSFVGANSTNGALTPALTGMPVVLTVATQPVADQPQPAKRIADWVQEDTDDSPLSNEPVTTQIARVERGLTKNSASPMWRCTTASGEQVNIFHHADAEKNNYALFEKAGWSETLDLLPIGVLRELDTPISITMQRDGRWWNITAVEPRVKVTQEVALAMAAELIGQTNMSLVETYSGAINSTAFQTLLDAAVALNDTDEAPSETHWYLIGEEQQEQELTTDQAAALRTKLIRVRGPYPTKTAAIDMVTPF